MWRVVVEFDTRKDCPYHTGVECTHPKSDEGLVCDEGDLREPPERCPGRCGNCVHDLIKKIPFGYLCQKCRMFNQYEVKK
jgi:hypothetical protein